MSAAGTSTIVSSSDTAIIARISGSVTIHPCTTYESRSVANRVGECFDWDSLPKNDRCIAALRSEPLLVVATPSASTWPQHLMRASGLAIRQTRARPLAGEHCVALDRESC